VKNIILIFLSLFLLLSAGKKAENTVKPVFPSVSLTVLAQKPVTIGDPIDLSLTIYHKRREKVKYPEESEKFYPFILKEVRTERKKMKHGEYKTMVIYTLTSFQTGNIPLPPLGVKVGEIALQTEPQVIPVLSVLPKNPSLKDIVPPYRTRIRLFTIVIILLLICAAFILFAAISKYIIKRTQKKKTPVTSETFFDPYLYSLNQLEEIKRAHLAHQADEKNIYSKVSYILKLFFGHVLIIKALEMTTNELKNHLKKKDFSSINPALLLNLLERSDMVKFAKEKPLGKMINEDIEQSITIIKEVQKAAVKAEGAAQQNSKRGTNSGI